MAIRLNGSTSGYIEIDAPAVAGTTAITLPATSGGNFVVTDSAGDLNIDSGTFFVDASADRVGVGTSSPDAPLHVKSSGTSSTIFRCNASDDVNLIQVYENSGGGGELYVKDTSGSPKVLLHTSGASYFTGGNVGVGTTSPSKKFHVQSDDFDVALFRRNNSTGSTSIYLDNTSQSGAAIQSQGNGAGGLTFFISNSGTLTRAVDIDSSGRVGIGTSSPNKELEVAKSDRSAGAVIRLTNSTDASNWAANDLIGTLDFYTTDASAAGQKAAIKAIADTGSASSYPSRVALDFVTSTSNTPTTKMRITHDGNVGIGTTSPDTQLQVYGASGNLLKFQSSTTMGTAGQNMGISFAQSGNVEVSSIKSLVESSGKIGLTFSTYNSGLSESARIDSSGRLLVGTSTARANFFNSTGTGLLQVEGTGGGTNRATMSLTNNSSGNDGAWLVINKSNGNADGSNTLVSSGNTLGSIGFQGSDGSELVFGATITAEVDGNPGANDMPGRLIFSTTEDGNSSPTERMRISQSGRVGVNINGDSWSNHPAILGAFKGTLSTGANESVCHVATNTSGSSTTHFYFASSNYTSSRDSEFYVQNDGNVKADGSFSGGGADYAEYFEWDDGNPTDEDRRGLSVALTNGNKIRVATSSDASSMIIGVISATPAVVGDSDLVDRWKGKYLKDDFGAYLVAEDGGRVFNPDYDPDQEYVAREDRPEWDCVGLMGKLRIKKGQPTGDRWIKMRDISDNVEEWLVR